MKLSQRQPIIPADVARTSTPDLASATDFSHLCSVEWAAGLGPAATLSLKSPSGIGPQTLDQVPSIFRNVSSTCGEAARAMQSVSPILIAAFARMENHPGFPSYFQEPLRWRLSSGV